MDWEDDAFLEDEFADVLEEEDEDTEVAQFTNPNTSFTHEVNWYNCDAQCHAVLDMTLVHHNELLTHAQDISMTAWQRTSAASPTESSYGLKLLLSFP